MTRFRPFTLTPLVLFGVGGLLASIAGANGQTASDSRWQNSRPVVGGTADAALARPRTITGSQNLEMLRHRGPAGKPCLSIGGYARPLSPSSKLLDHVIVADNACSQAIKVQVCYLGSSQCVLLDVAGHAHKEALLGASVGSKDFNFEFRERF